MIAGAALAEWLADTTRQIATHERANDCAKGWFDSSLVLDLRRELDAMEPKTASGVMCAAVRFMNRSDEIIGRVEEMIGTTADDPFFCPPFTPVSSDFHTALLLVDDPSVTIAIGVTSVSGLAAKKAIVRPDTSIGFTGFLTVFQFIKAGGATLSFWEAPHIDGRFAGTESGKCRLVRRRQIRDGEKIVMDGRFESFVIEHATSDMVYLQAVIHAERAPLGVEYDSKNLSFVGASSTDEASSRTQMMVTLLRMMGRKDALDLVEEALNSPHFYTRWHIMREYLAMDAEAALPSLRRMALSDPHPELRAAATQTLELFFPEEVDAEPVKIQCRA